MSDEGAADEAFWATVEVPDLWAGAAPYAFTDTMTRVLASAGCSRSAEGVYWPTAELRHRLLTARIPDQPQPAKPQRSGGVGSAVPAAPFGTHAAQKERRKAERKLLKKQAKQAAAEVSRTNTEAPSSAAAPAPLPDLAAASKAAAKAARREERRAARKAERKAAKQARKL